MPIHDWPWPFAIRIFNSGGDRPPLPTKFCGREDRKILRLLPLIYAILPRRCRRGSHQAINRFIIAHLFWLCKYFFALFSIFSVRFSAGGQRMESVPAKVEGKSILYLLYLSSRRRIISIPSPATRTPPSVSETPSGAVSLLPIEYLLILKTSPFHLTAGTPKTFAGP